MQSSLSESIPIKLVVVGDGSVGKTCMLVSYTKNQFPTDYVPTIFENYMSQVKVDDKMVNLGLWDTAGQEEYSQLREISYPQSDVFLVTFSVNQPSSFSNAVKKWYPELQQKAPNAIKIFIGNKIDLRPDTQDVDENKFVTYPIAYKVVSDMNCKYLECSALTQKGLKQIFDESIKAVLKKRSQLQQAKTSTAGSKHKTLAEDKKQNQDNSGCCLM